jgi:hypothetical protein
MQRRDSNQNQILSANTSDLSVSIRENNKSKEEAEVVYSRGDDSDQDYYVKAEDI